MANAVYTTLRLLDPRLSALLRQSTDASKQRRYASACARYALDTTSLRNATLDEAVIQAGTLGSAAMTSKIDQLRQSVERLVEQLDAAAFDAQDALDAGKGPREAYDTAFSRARAATAVLRSLDATPFTAAAEACYEAFHATENAAALIKIAEETLR
jgi:hypothetical protein